jgi:hypothetical protein
MKGIQSGRTAANTGSSKGKPPMSVRYATIITDDDGREVVSVIGAFESAPLARASRVEQVVSGVLIGMVRGGPVDAVGGFGFPRGSQGVDGRAVGMARAGLKDWPEAGTPAPAAEPVKPRLPDTKATPTLTTKPVPTAKPVVPAKPEKMAKVSQPFETKTEAARPARSRQPKAMPGTSRPSKSGKATAGRAAKPVRAAKPTKPAKPTRLATAAE